MLAVSASNVLAAQSLPSTDFRNPGSVLKGLNETFKMEKQNGKYFTIFYAVYRRKERELAFSNAGHPPAFLVTGPGANAVKQHRLQSQGPMIGACPDLEFDTVVIKLDSFARLLVYSDGVCEISRPDETMWKFEEFAEYMCSLPQEGGIKQTLGHVREMHASEVLDDDFSLIEVTF